MKWLYPESSQRMCPYLSPSLPEGKISKIKPSCCLSPGGFCRQKQK